MFFGMVSFLVVCHPARSSSTTACDPRATIVEVHLHGLGVDIGQDQGGADTARQADRPEEVSIVVALVGGLAGPCSTPRPLPDDAVLLTDPGGAGLRLRQAKPIGEASGGLVLEPDLDAPTFRQVPDMGVQGPEEVF